VIPYITGRLFDAILDQNALNIFSWQIQAVVFWMGLWVVIQLITYSLEQLRSYQTSLFDMVLFSSYIIKAYNYLLHLHLSFHKKRKIGPIINTAQRTANMFSDIVTRVMINSAPQFISIIIALIITITFNYKLALVMILGVTIYVLVL